MHAQCREAMHYVFTNLIRNVPIPNISIRIKLLPDDFIPGLSSIFQKRNLL